MIIGLFFFFKQIQRRIYKYKYFRLCLTIVIFVHFKPSSHTGPRHLVDDNMQQVLKRDIYFGL